MSELIIKLISKIQLSIINRKGLKYPLAIAEKDYYLAIILKIICHSELRKKLIFKGGTALHHIYLPQLRFSEDLDFSTNFSKIKLNELEEVFKSYNFLKIKKEFNSEKTIKIEKLQYFGLLKQSNSLKIEIDFSQNVILKPLELNYQNNYGVKTRVRVMDIREIAAEKIRAMNDRARYRDFYDFVMIYKKIGINFNEVISLVKLKEVRKIISTKNILNNWNIAKFDKNLDIQIIYYTEDLKDIEVESILKKIKFSDIKK